jgi:ribosomal protein S18 acetylase RimI-like enzyme
MPISTIRTENDVDDMSSMIKEFRSMLPTTGSLLEPSVESQGIVKPVNPVIPDIGFIVRNDAGAIGFIAAKILTDYYYLQYLYVRHGWRGLQIGTNLIGQLPTDKPVLLIVRKDHPDSKEAIKFYEANKFVRTKDIGSNKLLMRRT